MKKIAKWLHTQRILIFAVLVMALLGIGATMALFTDTEAAVNTFTVGNNTITVTEEPENLTKKNIGITNNGTIPVYVRMQVNVPEGIPYLALKGGKEVASTLKVVYNSDPDFEPEDLKDWVYDEEDDFWYYRNVLWPKDKVDEDTTGQLKKHAELFSSVSLVDSETEQPPVMSDEEMARIKELLDITVYGESVQSEGFPENVMAEIAAATNNPKGNPAKIAFDEVVKKNQAIQ